MNRIRVLSILGALVTIGLASVVVIHMTSASAKPHAHVQVAQAPKPQPKPKPPTTTVPTITYSVPPEVPSNMVWAMGTTSAEGPWKSAPAGLITALVDLEKPYIAGPQYLSTTANGYYTYIAQDIKARSWYAYYITMPQDKAGPDYNGDYGIAELTRNGWLVSMAPMSNGGFLPNNPQVGDNPKPPLSVYADLSGQPLSQITPPPTTTPPTTTPPMGQPLDPQTASQEWYSQSMVFMTTTNSWVSGSGQVSYAQELSAIDAFEAFLANTVWPSAVQVDMANFESDLITAATNLQISSNQFGTALQTVNAQAGVVSSDFTQVYGIQFPSSANPYPGAQCQPAQLICD